MIVFGNCWACGFPMTFNPTWVPSLPVNGVKEPICEACMARANAQRVEMGMEPHAIHPLAYEPEVTT